MIVEFDYILSVFFGASLAVGLGTWFLSGKFKLPG